MLENLKPAAPDKIIALIGMFREDPRKEKLDLGVGVYKDAAGRTPIINTNAGRDHWPQCYSMVLAGGGIRGGQVVGESDSTGAFPKSRPIRPADIHATVFSALGYDSRGISYHLADGRPFQLSDGEVIRELL